jgi:hypothetical protein
VVRAEIHPAALTALSVEQSSSPHLCLRRADVRDEGRYRCSSIAARPPASHPRRDHANRRVREIAHRPGERRLRTYRCS